MATRPKTQEEKDAEKLAEKEKYGLTEGLNLNDKTMKTENKKEITRRFRNILDDIITRNKALNKLGLDIAKKGSGHVAQFDNGNVYTAKDVKDLLKQLNFEIAELAKYRQYANRRGRPTGSSGQDSIKYANIAVGVDPKTGEQIMDDGLIGFFTDAQNAGMLDGPNGEKVDITTFLTRGYTTESIINKLFPIYFAHSDASPDPSVGGRTLDIKKDKIFMDWFGEIINKKTVTVKEKEPGAPKGAPKVRVERPLIDVFNNIYVKSVISDLTTPRKELDPEELKDAEEKFGAKIAKEVESVTAVSELWKARKRQEALEREAAKKSGTKLPRTRSKSKSKSKSKSPPKKGTKPASGGKKKAASKPASGGKSKATKPKSGGKKSKA